MCTFLYVAHVISIYYIGENGLVQFVLFRAKTLGKRLVRNCEWILILSMFFAYFATIQSVISYGESIVELTTPFHSFHALV